MRNDIQQRLDALYTGGAVTLSAGDHLQDGPIFVSGPCRMLRGEVWAYNADPNGVFEARGGTKLKMTAPGFPAITAADDQVSEGMVIRDIGIQGAICGMDTRGLFDPALPDANAGLCFRGQRIDQGEFAKLSFCGLGSGVCACCDAELDACIFEKLNTDGCCIGVYFAPRAAYYTKIRSCIIADTPWHGVWVRGGNALHNLELSDLTLVRNCGAAPEGVSPAAAVYLDNVSNCAFSRNLIDDPGTFWYYPPDAVRNDERQPSHRDAVGLYVTGSRNRICDNTILRTQTAMVIHGNDNVLMNNIVSGDIVITGTGNIVMNPVFTRPDARLILTGAADTQLIGVPDERIVYGG